MSNDTKLQQLFQLLRWFGAAMIVTAAGTFLVQSWDETGDVKRYLALLGATALLPFVGYYCGIRLQEGRSARVMVLAFLALVPIHAGLLGGFVLSRFGDVGTALAPVAQWIAPSKTVAMLLVAAASTVLIPMTWACFRVLSRRHAGLLTASSVGAQALLLIPSRSATAASIAIAAIVSVASWSAIRTKPETPEAKLAVWSLLAPGAIVAARQILFYDMSAAFWAVVATASAIGLFALGRKSGDRSVERVALVPTMIAGAALLVDLTPAWDLSLSTAWMSYGLITGGTLLFFSWLSVRSKRFFVHAAMTINALVPALLLFVGFSAWAALQLIAMGIAFGSYGFLTSRRGALYSGIGLVGTGFVVEVEHAIRAFEASGWLAIGAFGVILVALTAWLESRARVARSTQSSCQSVQKDGRIAAMMAVAPGSADLPFDEMIEESGAT